MKIGYALLVPRAVENRVQRMAWEIHRRWRTGVAARDVPPHVSLKQPFDVAEDLPAAERYLVAFARDVPPVTIRCRGYLLWETTFVVDVEATSEVRGLHARLNRELPAVFPDPSAPFDGDVYHFHLTVMMGGATVEDYREIHDAFAQEPFADTFLAREIAMFVCDDSAPGAPKYMVHTVLPLEGLAGGARPPRRGAR